MLEQTGDSVQHRHEDEFQPPAPAELHPSAPVLDMDRRLETLAKAVGEDVAQQFFWKAETGTIQTYEHRLTYRYVHIDSVTGRFCDQQRNPLSAKEALAHALPSLPMVRPSTALALAPIVLEPDLLPFVRPALATREQPSPAGASPEVPDSARLGGAASRLYLRLRAKLLELGTFAKSTSAPMLDPREHRADLQESDLSLASFTRRPA